MVSSHVEVGLVGTMWNICGQEESRIWILFWQDMKKMKRNFWREEHWFREIMINDREEKSFSKSMWFSPQSQKHAILWIEIMLLKLVTLEECGFEHIYLMIRNKISRRDPLWEWKHDELCKPIPSKTNQQKVIFEAYSENFPKDTIANE